MVETVSIEHLPWAVAGAWKPCPCIQGSPCSPSCTCHARLLSGGCRVCHGYGSLEQRRGGVAGRIYALPETVRPACGHTPSQAPAEWWAEFKEWHTPICPGWTPSEDLAVLWDAAIEGLNRIVPIKNDGPGFRCNITPNSAAAEPNYEGWSDGDFTLDEPPKWRPTQIEALRRALVKLLVAENWTLGTIPDA